MADPTTGTGKTDKPGPPAFTPANGVAVADVRTMRHVSRAEQERLSADAQVEPGPPSSTWSCASGGATRFTANARPTPPTSEPAPMPAGRGVPDAGPGCAPPPHGGPSGRCSSCRSCSRWRWRGSGRSASR